VGKGEGVSDSTKGGNNMDLSSGVSNSNRGMYTTACEKSPHRSMIDKWINEGKSNMYISQQLNSLGEKISDKSVGKYRQYREEHLSKELAKNPMYQAQVQKATDTLIEEVGKMKQVNVLNLISDTIAHCAELINQSKMDDIRIKNIQDLRYVQMTMVEMLKLYGDTILKAQQFAKIEDDPNLLKPTVNVNVKSVLTDLLGGMDESQKFALIDRIRAGSGQHVTGVSSAQYEQDTPDDEE
jgi:hypothetical protein